MKRIAQTMFGTYSHPEYVEPNQPIPNTPTKSLVVYTHFATCLRTLPQPFASFVISDARNFTFVIAKSSQSSFRLCLRRFLRILCVFGCLFVCVRICVKAIFFFSIISSDFDNRSGGGGVGGGELLQVNFQSRLLGVCLSFAELFDELT